MSARRSGSRRSGRSGKKNSPAGPNVLESDAIIIVEGRADVLNLLRFGIKNAVAVEGYQHPGVDSSTSAGRRLTTAFFDGDRGGEADPARTSCRSQTSTFVAVLPPGKERRGHDKKRGHKDAPETRCRSKYVRDQYFENTAELPSDLGRPVRAAPAHDEGDQETDDRSAGAGQKKARGGTAKTPVTIRDHMEGCPGKEDRQVPEQRYGGDPREPRQTRWKRR